ncbi:MAG: hypothetical protein CITR_02251 [Citrobacter freundii]
MVALSVANQAKEQKHKSPHKRAFMSLGSRGSFAYLFCLLTVWSVSN